MAKARQTKTDKVHKMLTFKADVRRALPRMSAVCGTKRTLDAIAAMTASGPEPTFAKILDAAARPVEAAIRAPRSIFHVQTTTSRQTDPSIAAAIPPDNG